jgi:hypothetical protein
MMLIDRDQGGAGAGSRVLNLREQTSPPAGLSSAQSPDRPRRLGPLLASFLPLDSATIKRLALRAVDADASNMERSDV